MSINQGLRRRMIPKNPNVKTCGQSQVYFLPWKAKLIKKATLTLSADIPCLFADGNMFTTHSFYPGEGAKLK